MKHLIAFALVTLTTLSAMAVQTKICFSERNSDIGRGNRVVLTITQRTLTIRDLTQTGWEGRFQRSGNVNGRDGKTYLVYDLGSNDGWNHALVDTALQSPRTTGWLKIRNRGEGYFESKFFCRDN